MSQRLPMPFGPGLDRAKGAMVVDPGELDDARNVYARDWKLHQRPGMQGTPYPDLPWGTDVVGIFPLKATRDVIFVILDRSTRKLRIYRLNPSASPAMQNAGDWGTLNINAPLPIVTAAESYGKLFLAHDEKTYTYRLKTIYYTPDAVDANVGTLTDLTGDLNGDGVSATIYFRGVVSHLAYLAGWGYGTETVGNEDRPELVRLSDAGNPTVFYPETQFQCGVRSDPVLACGPAGRVLVACKQTESFRIVGTNPDDFGVEVCDPQHGCVSARLQESIGDALYVWSEEGPMVSRMGEPFVDLSIPLELSGPLPDGITTPGDQRTGFCEYDAATKILYFGFPTLGDFSTGPSSPTPAFLCSIRDETNPRWTYAEFQQAIYCAGPVLLGKAPPPSIIGYASAVSAVDAGIGAGNAGRKITLSWTNNSDYGYELVQVFYRESGGTYSLLTSLTLSQSTGVTIDGFDPLQTYDFALRYYRDGGVKTGYESNNPDDWTGATVAGAKTTASTACGTPTMTTASWARTSATEAYVSLAWTLADLYVPLMVQKSPDNVNWTDVELLDGDLAARTYAYLVQAGEESATYYFRVRPKRGATLGTAATGISCFTGPTGQLTGFSLLYQESASTFGVCFRAPNSSNGYAAPWDATHYDIRISPDESTWTTIVTAGTITSGRNWVDRNTLTPSQTGAYTDPTKRTYVQVRIGYQTYGVIDYGPWSSIAGPSRYLVVDPALTIPSTTNVTSTNAPSYPATVTTPGVGTEDLAFLLLIASSGTGLAAAPIVVAGGTGIDLSVYVAPGVSGTYPALYASKCKYYISGSDYTKVRARALTFVNSWGVAP